MHILIRYLYGAIVTAFFASHVVIADELRFVTLEFAPFIYGHAKKVAGPGRDIIDAVCTEANIECDYDIYPWRRAQELIKTGEADGMMVIGRNSKREQWIRFSPPHFRTEYGIFVRTDSALHFTDSSQLEGLTIGVFSPSNTASQLKGIRDQMSTQGLTPIRIDERPDDASGFRKLAAGRIDAVYSNRDRGRHILDVEKLVPHIRYAGGHKGIYYYAGFAKNFSNQGLLDRFDTAWRDLFRLGDAQKIIESYNLEPADIE